MTTCWETYPDTRVHYGLLFGVIACLIAWFVMEHTVFGFKVRTIGGNLRAARIVGLSVGKISLVTCFLAGAAAGLAGMAEVAGVQGRANESLRAGYGYAASWSPSWLVKMGWGFSSSPSCWEVFSPVAAFCNGPITYRTPRSWFSRESFFWWSCSAIRSTGGSPSSGKGPAMSADSIGWLGVPLAIVAGAIRGALRSCSSASGNASRKKAERSTSVLKARCHWAR